MAGARKKQPMPKALVPKVPQTVSVAQKAAPGMHITSGEKNHTPVIGTSTATQDKSFFFLLPCTTNSPNRWFCPCGHSDFGWLNSGFESWGCSQSYVSPRWVLDMFCMCLVNLFFILVSWAYGSKYRLKETQEIAAHHTSKVDTQIKHPHKVGNVQKAMSLMNKPKLWAGFIVSFLYFFSSCKAYYN